jgi:hypothetical protein
MENNMNDASQEPYFAEPIKQLSTKQMTAFFKHIDSIIIIIEKHDPNETRSAQVAREIRNSLACYKELCRGRKMLPVSLSSQGLQESKFRRPHSIFSRATVQLHE